MPTPHGDDRVQQTITVGKREEAGKGYREAWFSQFKCAHLFDVYIGVVFPFFVDLVFVLSARALDTSCTGFDFTFGSRKTVILHMVAELGWCTLPWRS